MTSDEHLYWYTLPIVEGINFIEKGINKLVDFVFGKFERKLDENIQVVDEVKERNNRIRLIYEATKNKDVISDEDKVKIANFINYGDIDKEETCPEAEVSRTQEFEQNEQTR